MQIINKTSSKHIFTYTWYIYPVLIIIASFIWLWAFQAYHQPSAHQKLDIFFSTEINDFSFLDKIKNEHYDRENLREVNSHYCLPSTLGYYNKLMIFVSDADLLVLDEESFKGFSNYTSNYFVEINDDVKSKYFNNPYTYMSFNEKDYGILIKKKGETNYLNNYMVLDEEKDYYICLSVTSQNLGSILDNDNAPYDNALTYMNYLLMETL